MSARFADHFWPALAGAAVAFLVRLILGDLTIALIGVFVFAVSYCVLVAIAHAMKWAHAPFVYAVIAAVATTFAFLAGHLT